MAILFPTSLDGFLNPAATDKLNSPAHHLQHDDENDAILALEAKVGVNASAVTSSHDYKLSDITGASKASVTLTGEIKIWPAVAVPTGYLSCDGSIISRTTYADLFAVLSITYDAGDGVTTFGLPNFSGRIPVGIDDAQTEFNSIGEIGGEKSHTLTTAELAAHNHPISISDSGHAHGVTDPQHRHDILNVYHVNNNQGFTGTGRNPLEADGANQNLQTALASTGISILANTTGITASSSNSGGGGAHNNLSPYLTITYIIKT